MKAEEVLRSLDSDLNSGLKAAEVETRLRQYGYNEVPEKKANPVARFANKFWGLTAWMLEIIIVLSWILQRYSDLYIVAGLLVFNSILGFAEEQRASNAVEALKERLQVNARVLRDGSWKTVLARELVPGDIVRNRSGDFVPADIKIATGELEVDQSALTGESMEIGKKPDDLLYSGSIVKRGESTGIAVSTGTKTYFGRTAQLVQLAKPKLHLEEVVSNVVRWLLTIVVGLTALAFVFSVLKGNNLLDLLPIILVLLLSAIPVALPAMFTVSMALGSMELAKKGVLVTRLSASEDAATMNVLCADKTGTITMNRLSIAKVIPLNRFVEQQVILYGALASEEANQDPIDLAFINMAKQQNLLGPSFKQLSFIPFDPKTRRTEASVQKNDHELRVMKGAVNVIAAACGLEKNVIDQLELRMSDFASKGYRTLAIAKSDNEKEPELVGLVALRDMPRPDSKQLIEELRELGISVKMLTGDALPIAKEIATAVGLGENVIKAAYLKESIRQDPMEATEVADSSDGFAEIYPEDKYTIVKSLQATKHVVGMTGDGVNDAPALRQAEVGIAVSNATDVAKGAASVVLINEGLTGIVDLIKNGRIIFERITAWILSKIVRTLQIATFVVLSFLLTGDYVVSAFAIILYFFMTDFVKIALSTDNLKWSRKPDTWNVTSLVKASTILSLLVVGESFALLYVAINIFHLTVADQTLYTFTFEILFYSAMFLIFNVRERGHFWNSRPSRTLLVAIILSTVAATIVTTVGLPGLVPISIGETLFVISCSAAFSLILNDMVKYLIVKKTEIRW
ncbi:MAG TPA: plasma-membrane proton-efflux P-type ATPase [candidate division Zixibacteria bacterium]|nr:plasma-membrane proton-efflux P-type ATPase [candidate division Zixibacteria bacterium]